MNSKKSKWIYDTKSPGGALVYRKGNAALLIYHSIINFILPASLSMENATFTIENKNVSVDNFLSAPLIS